MNVSPSEIAEIRDSCAKRIELRARALERASADVVGAATILLDVSLVLRLVAAAEHVNTAGAGAPADGG